MAIDPEQLQGALDNLENEIRLIRIITLALFERTTQETQKAVVARFQGVLSGVAESAPLGTDPEIIVDLLARSQVYLNEMRKSSGET